jgi:hypothetical protein
MPKKVQLGWSEVLSAVAFDAVVEDVVQIERHLLARLVGVAGDQPAPAVGDTRQADHDHDAQKQLGRCCEALHCCDQY